MTLCFALSYFQSSQTQKSCCHTWEILISPITATTICSLCLRTTEDTLMGLQSPGSTHLTHTPAHQHTHPSHCFPGCHHKIRVLPCVKRWLTRLDPAHETEQCCGRPRPLAEQQLPVVRTASVQKSGHWDSLFELFWESCPAKRDGGYGGFSGRISFVKVLRSGHDARSSIQQQCHPYQSVQEMSC